MHVLINPSWKCQLSCPYCLLTHIAINRQAPEHTWQEWAEGIIAHVTPGSVVDVAGGDPLLFPGLAYFLRALGRTKIRWAITTNALSTEGVDELLSVLPSGCELVNISDHPGNRAAVQNIERIKKYYTVVRNRVDHPLAGKSAPEIHSLIPYQEYAEGTEQDYKLRLCNSGIGHWVADPAGDVFLCNVAMATGREPIGNLFDGKPLDQPDVPFTCNWGCSTCYTSVPGAWACEQTELMV